PLRIRKVADDQYAVLGTPTDCMHMAVNCVLEQRADLVISGINHGANLGDDVLYSGTVAAATEGSLLGMPAIAVSLCGLKNFATAAQIVRELVVKHLQNPLPAGRILNVNVPDCAPSELRGWEVTRLGARHRAETMIKSEDPRGSTIYWIGPAAEKQDAGKGTDFYAIERNFVSLTPLQVDLTAHDTLAALGDWVSSAR
ncbi:MAG: 5'/3'-nucleotidase SurE, partial [Enterovibrio sp.]